MLLQHLKARHRDFRQYAEDLTCASAEKAQRDVLNSEFDEREHHLLVSANLNDSDIEELLTDMLRYSYNYATSSYGNMSGVVNFLALVELWEQEPIVRKLYRETSNEETVIPAHSWAMDPYLYYEAGTATAEDELIQKIRLHFGQGSRTALNARAAQNQTDIYKAVHSSFFWPAHLDVMRSLVCEALTDGKPGKPRTSEAGDNVVVSWDAPGYDTDSVTGYQILRSVNGATLTVHVADTGTPETAWTHENPPEGDLVFAVKAIYDGYYLGPASIHPNIGAIGAPSIVGTAQVGSELTADTSDIGDADGLTTVSYSYQWVADDSEIAEAETKAHTLTDTQEGKTIKVIVSFTDDRGNEESLTSAATASVAPPVNSPATGSPTISGTPQVGKTLTADTYGITDEDGLSNASLAYQWIRSGGTTDSDIQDATNSTYTLVSDDSGKAIKVRVSFTDDAGNEETLTSPPLDPAQPYGLTATASGRTVVLTWNPPVGFSYLYDYQILRNRPELGEAEPLVYVNTGTAETTYTDTDVEPGVLYVYRVKAASYFARFTEASEPVEIRTAEAAANTPATGAPAISGDLVVGQTLSADTSAIEDDDGLTNPAFVYQWLADDTDISGATASSYTLVDSNEGKAIKVTVSFTDDAGNGERLSSAATASVAAAATPLTAEFLDTPSSHDGGDGLHLRAALQRGVRAELQDAAGPCLHSDRRRGDHGAAPGGAQQHPVGDHGCAGWQRRRDHHAARHNGLHSPGGHLHRGREDVVR